MPKYLANVLSRTIFVLLFKTILKLSKMSKVKCYSVRLQSLESISPKAYKATAFDGSTAIIPKSQVFGEDLSVQKSDAYWISAWVLEQKQLQYSKNKESWFDKESSQASNDGVEIERHVPEEIEVVEVEPISELLKDEPDPFIRLNEFVFIANQYSLYNNGLIHHKPWSKTVILYIKRLVNDKYQYISLCDASFDKQSGYTHIVDDKYYVKLIEERGIYLGLDWIKNFCKVSQINELKSTKSLYRETWSPSSEEGVDIMLIGEIGSDDAHVIRREKNNSYTVRNPWYLHNGMPHKNQFKSLKDAKSFIAKLEQVNDELKLTTKYLRCKA